MTPSEVRRRYSNGRVLEVVLRNGYRKRGIWAKGDISKVLRVADQRTGEEELASFVVGSDALKESKSITNAIRGVGSEIRRGQ